MARKSAKCIFVSDTRYRQRDVAYKIITISATTSLVVLMVTMLFALSFQKAISGPILELAKTAESITARGDYTLEAKTGYSGETGILARAFNAMLSEA